MTIIIPPLSPFPGRGAAPEDYISLADTTMQQLPGVVDGIRAVSDAFNLGTGVLATGYLPPVAYAAGITVKLALQTVQRGETTYAPLIERLPFVTGGEFDMTAWRVVQGVTSMELAEPGAAARVAYTAPGAGSVPSTVENKLTESASIIDTGGVGNYNPATGTGVNCINALSQISARGPSRQRVRFPAIPGQSNNYLLSFPAGYTVADGTIIIDADPGVTLYVEGVVLACDFVRPTKQVFVGFDPASPSLPMIKTAHPCLSSQTPNENEKSRWLNRGDISAPVRTMVDPRTGWRGALLTYPGSPDHGGDGAGFAGTSKISFDATSVVVTSSAGDGALHAGYTRLLVGDELGARLELPSGSSVGTPTVIVRSATGYSGVQFSSQACSWMKKNFGSELVQGPATPLGMANHQSYSPFLSIITVRLLSAYTYQILVQGMPVYEGNSVDPIQEVGFGAYVAASGMFRWTDIYVSRGHAPAAARSISLFVIGDSISADQHGCWARNCRAALEGTYGARVVQYNNQAIAGHDSAAQLAVLRANGVPAGTTHSVVQIGTNNAQSASPVADLVAHVAEMFDRLEAAGSKIVAGIPPVWYTQAQAGHRGQASLNYAGATPYRMALMRLCASRNIPLLDSLPAYGPIIADFVNPLLERDLRALDPMVFDNIHPGSHMAKLMGYAYAGLLLGQMAYVGTNAVPWTNLPATWPVQNNWAVDPTEGAQFKICDDGSRRLRANYSTGLGATLADGTTVHVVGRLLWPTGRPVRCDGYTPTGARVMLILGTDGQLKIYGAAGIGATQVYVDTGRYEVD